MFFFIVVFSVVLVLLVYLLFYVLSYKWDSSMEEISSYECGFEPLCGTRVEFSYRFFLIAILFLIFDVEISLMLSVPYMWGVLMGMWVFYLFLGILIFGLLYEYYYGSLDWV